MAISFKPEVRFNLFLPEMAKVLELASYWSAMNKMNVELNSGNDSAHMSGSLHYFDLAVDLDTAGDKPEDLKSLHTYLSKTLPIGYDVIFEKNHVHVEWDAHR